MKLCSLERPSKEQVLVFLRSLDGVKLSYREARATQGDFPAGYQHDFHRVQLGVGPETFQRACEAIRLWKMFPKSWMDLIPKPAAIVEGQMVAVVAHTFGVWWLNACRIVYVVDTTTPTHRFGFAYGTVIHAECGEERFLVEMLEDGSVWYDLRAFSRPQHWLVRLAYPLARRLQKRFAIDSLQSMRVAVSGRE